MRFPLKVQLVDSLAEFGRTRSLVMAGLLTGAAVIIDRLFTFEVSPVLEIGFAFLATALCASLCAPIRTQCFAKYFWTARWRSMSRSPFCTS